MIEFFKQFWDISAPGFKDIFDIISVAFLLYQIYKLFFHTRIAPVAIGLGFILFTSLISHVFQLTTLNWLFDIISNYIIIALIVVLQPELRRVFYKMGDVKWYKDIIPNFEFSVEEIVQATIEMAENKTGALIVLVNNVGLDNLTEGAIPLNAKITKELILSVFFEKNPLHDGALVFEKGLITAAACYLPLSTSKQLKKTHGSRHRAGLGISEESDALSIIVSEEKGKISVCYAGEMQERINSVILKSLLTAYNNKKLEDEWDVLFIDKKTKPPLKKNNGSKVKSSSQIKSKTEGKKNEN